MSPKTIIDKLYIAIDEINKKYNLSIQVDSMSDIANKNGVFVKTYVNCILINDNIHKFAFYIDKNDTKNSLMKKIVNSLTKVVLLKEWQR